MEETKAIQAYSDPVKIAGATDDEMKGKLLIIFSFIGLTNYPDFHNEVVLLSFIRANYGMFTLKEMHLAFELAVAGKLNVDTDHYQQFSPAYFSRIMNAYKIWVSEVRKQYDKPKPIEHKVSVSQNQWRGTIQKCYEGFNSKTNWKLWPVEFYDQLTQDGFIQLRWHEKYLDECRKTLCNEIHVKLAMSNDEGQSKSLETLLVGYREKNKESEVILMAKQMSVKELFEFGKEIDHKGFYEQ